MTTRCASSDSFPSSGGVHAENDYYDHVRQQLIGLLDTVPERVLELGCASGGTLAYLKQRGARETFGVELDPDAAEDARAHVDHVWQGDVETIDLPIEESSLDGIVVADVLEHLRDPWEALGRWTRFLRSGGVVLASVPNVRHFSVSLPLLLRGRWQYGDTGILDRTHLRFFTRKSAIELFTAAGLQVERVQPALGPRRRMLDIATVGLFRDLLATQYFLLARKT